MKRVTKVVLLITILVLASVNMAIAFDPLSDPSLVAWWAFDEGTGTLAADGSGHGNNGTLNGSAAWVPGVYGQALVLNGSDTYVSTEQSLLSDLPEFTLAGWVNVVNTESYAGLFGQNDLVEFGFTSENGGGLGVWMSGNGWTYVGADYSFAYPSWHHVALTGNADRVVMYIDGQEQASDDGGMTAGTSTYGFNIGAYVFNDNAAAVEGELDDVWVYSRALSQEEIQTLMTGLGGPGRASSADPENEANDVPRDSILSWTPGDFAQTHHVYFSSSLADVNAATPDNPLDILTVQNQEANTFDPGRLDFGQTYYWRVDEVNGTPDKTVFRGDIWQFTAEPHSLQIPGSAIAVTASSFANEFSMPVKIVDGSGLGPDNTHSVNAETMWFSGPAELDPWVQFEFDGVKKLDTMRVWNSNSAAEMAIGWGVKDVNIAYSVDGETWTVLDAAKQFNRASGLPAYNQPDSIGFDGVAARHVRLNILNNWGGLLMSYSLSEVQFAMIPAQARSPEPADSSEDVLPDTVATWRAGRDAAEHKVTMGTDPNAVAEGLAPSVTSISPSLDLAPLNLQLDETYYWRVDEVNAAEPVSTWAGPVWRLNTAATVTVDDFEGYNNVSPDRPFQTWLDGFGYSADEFFSVEYEGNGTGAGIGHDIWNLGSPHFGGQIMETVVTLAGSSQSMPLYYDNSNGVASQTDRHWSTPQDWSGHGIQTLVLSFYGTESNTGDLYLKINDTKIPYPGDASDLTKLRWNPWHVDLTRLTVNSVTTLSIGVDGNGATGMILLDDILLYRSVPEQVTPVAPSAEGLVAHWTLDDEAGTSAADSAGNHTGTVSSTAQWTTGHLGGALQLDGINAYVDCGADATLDITDVITLSVWVNPADAGNGEHNPFMAKGDHAYTLKHGPGNAFEFLLYQGAWNYIQVPVTEAFNGNWYHLTGTYDGTQLKLYVNGMLGATLETGGAIDSSADAVNLGRNSEYPDRLFEGTLDDARIYNRVLSDAEILYLSNQ